MCIITDENNIVQSISLIPGVGLIPENWHCYFPVDLPADGLREGDTYKP